MQECSKRHELGLVLADAVEKLASLGKDSGHPAEREAARQAAQMAKQTYDNHVAEHQCHDVHDLCVEPAMGKRQPKQR
jgi:hypothetical protein